MKLIFTKGAGKYDLMDVQRDDGSFEQVACPKQGIIPHDMVHYAVEHTLQARGFLARVGEGESADFRMTAQAESDAVERLVEVFQGDAWSGGGSSAADLLAMYQVTCRARECPQLPLGAAEVEAVRSVIRALGERWQAVAVGEALELPL
ncbi:MAG: hypothetical protein U1F22_08345 [Lysobacterales bacterium]